MAVCVAARQPEAEPAKLLRTAPTKSRRESAMSVQIITGGHRVAALVFQVIVLGGAAFAGLGVAFLVNPLLPF